MEKKYLDKTGIKRLVEQLSQHMGSGEGGGSVGKFTDLTDTPNSYTGAGGKVVAVKNDGTGLEFKTVEGGSGGEAGRVVLEATEDNPVDIDEIDWVESFTIKGNPLHIIGLPDDAYNFIMDIEADYVELAFDVSLHIPFDEADVVITQSLKFLDYASFDPNAYERICIYEDNEWVMSPWKNVGGSGGVRYRRLTDLRDAMITSNGIDYVFAFEDEMLSDGIIIDDALFIHLDNDFFIGKDIYPHSKLSYLNELLQYSLGTPIGSCYRVGDYNDGVFTLAYIKFISQDAALDFLNSYGSFQVYIAYRDSYTVED